MPWAGRVGFLMTAVMTGFISSHHCAKHVIFMPHKYHVFSEHPENDPTKTIWQPIHGHWTNQLHYVPFFGIAICLELCQFLLHGPAVRFRRHASPERWRRFWSASISGFSVRGTERMVFCNHWLACVDGECKKLRKRSCCGNWDSHREYGQRIFSCSCGHCRYLAICIGFLRLLMAAVRSSKLCLRFFALTGSQKPHAQCSKSLSHSMKYWLI